LRISIRLVLFDIDGTLLELQRRRTRLLASFAELLWITGQSDDWDG